MGSFTFQVTCTPSKYKAFTTQYEGIICAGEFVRNLCVNACIDPDTVDGITKNVNIYIQQENDDAVSKKPWAYNPYTSIQKYFNHSQYSDPIHIEIECLD